MKKILILIAFLATPQLSAAPYETAQRLTAGDVISAEVFNDILDRIELTLKDVTRSEMIGTWEVDISSISSNYWLTYWVKYSKLNG